MADSKAKRKEIMELDCPACGCGLQVDVQDGGIVTITDPYQKEGDGKASEGSESGADERDGEEASHAGADEGDPEGSNDPREDLSEDDSEDVTEKETGAFGDW